MGEFVEVTLEDTIKLEHLGGYEHFSRVCGLAVSSESAGVFQWAMRTKIAE
jgi:hypothetical protein